MSVKHFAINRPGPFGGTLHTTICGRARLGADGMNRTDDRNEVTCKLCASRLAGKSQHVDDDWSTLKQSDFPRHFPKQGGQQP